MGLASLPACCSIMGKKGASSPSQQIRSYGLKTPFHQLRGAAAPEIGARVCHEDTEAGVGGRLKRGLSVAPSGLKPSRSLNSDAKWLG